MAAVFCAKSIKNVEWVVYISTYFIKFIKSLFSLRKKLNLEWQSDKILTILVLLFSMEPGECDQWRQQSILTDCFRITEAVSIWICHMICAARNASLTAISIPTVKSMFCPEKPDSGKAIILNMSFSLKGMLLRNRIWKKWIGWSGNMWSRRWCGEENRIRSQTICTRISRSYFYAVLLRRKKW